MKLIATVVVAILATSVVQAHEEGAPPIDSNKYYTTLPVSSGPDKTIPDDLSMAPFQFADTPKVSVGLINDGSTIISGPLRYAYTAKLHAPFSVKTHYGKYDFFSGDEFYGVPMGGFYGNGPRGITYCGPRLNDKGIRTICILIMDNKPITAMPADRNIYLVTEFTGSYNATTTGLLKIKIEPNKLADNLLVDVRVSYRSARELKIITDVKKNGYIFSSIKNNVKLKNGIAMLCFGNGLLSLKSSDTGIHVEVVQSVLAHDSIIPRIISQN